LRQRRPDNIARVRPQVGLDLGGQARCMQPESACSCSWRALS
jgi:hypothetical protein